MRVDRGRVVEAVAWTSRGVDHAVRWYVTAPYRHEHWTKPPRLTGRPVVDAFLRGRGWLFARPTRRPRPWSMVERRPWSLAEREVLQERAAARDAAARGLVLVA